MRSFHSIISPKCGDQSKNKILYITIIKIDNKAAWYTWQWNRNFSWRNETYGNLRNNLLYRKSIKWYYL